LQYTALLSIISLVAFPEVEAKEKRAAFKNPNFQSMEQISSTGCDEEKEQPDKMYSILPARREKT